MLGSPLLSFALVATGEQTYQLFNVIFLEAQPPDSPSSTTKFTAFSQALSANLEEQIMISHARASQSIEAKV